MDARNVMKRTTRQPAIAMVFAAVLLFGAIGPVHAEKTPAQQAAPQMPREAVRALGQVPVQSGGRIRPFDSFARDIVREVTGHKRWNGEDPVSTVMRWLALPDQAYAEKNIPVAYGPLRTALGLEGGPKSYYSMEELVNVPDLREIATEAQQAQQAERDLTVMQKKTLDLMNRLAVLQGLFTHRSLTILPNRENPQGGWLSPHALEGDSSETAFNLAVAYTGLFESYRRGDWDIFLTSAKRMKKDVIASHGDEVDQDKLMTEFWYRRIDPWLIARSFYLGVILFLMIGVLGKPELMHKIAKGSLIAGFVMHTLALAVRWYIGGRAPWSNMYESIVTITWGVVAFSLFIPYKGFGKKIILPAAALIGFLSLTIASNNSLNPAINPLVPALQSYWLNIHVIVILMGYASVALGTGAGHAWIFMDIFKPGHRSALASISNTLYRLIQFTVLFLIVGIILGSVWANSAWGRYWGWDPKETWALLLWFYYLGLIHAGYAGWIQQRGLAIASVLGFQLMLMTYYGVNYYLAGLHSYAQGESVMVPPLMIGFVAIELTFVGWYAWYSHHRQQPRPVHR